LHQRSRSSAGYSSAGYYRLRRLLQVTAI